MHSWAIYKIKCCLDESVSLIDTFYLESRCSFLSSLLSKHRIVQRPSYPQNTLATFEFFLFPKLKIHHKSLRTKLTLKDVWHDSFTLYQKRSFRGVSTNGKLAVLNSKGTILKKSNVSFIVRFFLGKYSFNLDTFLTNFVYSIVLNGRREKSLEPLIITFRSHWTTPKTFNIIDRHADDYRILHTKRNTSECVKWWNPITLYWNNSIRENATSKKSFHSKPFLPFAITEQRKKADREKY